MSLTKKFSLLRILKFLKHKIFRLRDLPESISGGLAWGAAVSLTPLIGLHLFTCFLGTFIMRGNLVAATVGTIIGNPWTFPVFFFIEYKIGSIFYNVPVADFELTISYFFLNFDKLFIPTLIGSIPLSIATWFITYNVSKYFLLKNSKKWLKKK